MTTKHLARLMPRVGRILAVAAAIAVMGGAVQVGAHEKEKEKDHKKPWPKVRMCHAERDGHSHVIEISGEAEAAHRAHGDGRPGESVPRHARHRFDRDCQKVPQPLAPPPDPALACPCWNTYNQSQLLSVLSPTSAPAESYCIVDSSTVSLSQDLGVNTLVYAASFCMLRVNGVDVGSNFALTAPEAAACISEATALVPSITWCPQ